MALSDWSTSDRPRERLRDRGARELSVRELLAILVGSGSGVDTALDVADRVLEELEGSVRRLAAADPATLRRIGGVGPATASRLVAAFELGRRAASAAPGDDAGAVRGPADVHRHMGPRLRDLRQEEFHVLLLDARHRLLRKALVTRGTLDASLIHPREVFRLAILEGAAGVILVHNHPSGDPTPSPEDRAVTRQLSDAGRAVGIPVLDHVVVGGGRWRSLAEDGSL
jgi:DNA repair protein RadC